MPLQRRLPKRGFTNVFKKLVGVVNVGALDTFAEGARIDRQTLLEVGLISKKHEIVKLLGDGELTRKLVIAVDKVSESARRKIEAAGGTIEAVA